MLRDTHSSAAFRQRRHVASERPLSVDFRSTFEGPQMAYSVEKLENALAAFSCQAESRSPVRPMNRQRTNQKAVGGAQYEVVCPPPSEMQRSLCGPAISLAALETEFFNRIGRLLPFAIGTAKQTFADMRNSSTGCLGKHWEPPLSAGSGPSALPPKFPGCGRSTWKACRRIFHGNCGMKHPD